MSDTGRAPSRLSELSPEELERLARSHLDAMWGQLRAAGAAARANYHPLNIARRHPFAIAAAAGALVGLFIHRRRRAAARPAAAAPETLGRTFARSLFSNLATAAGRALPALASLWLARRSAQASQDDADRP